MHIVVKVLHKKLGCSYNKLLFSHWVILQNFYKHKSSRNMFRFTVSSIH